MRRVRCSIRKRYAGLHDVFPRDIQRIEYNDRDAPGLCVQRGRDGFGCVGEHARELVHRNDVIVPGEFVGFGSGGSGGDVVEVATHHQGPRVVQALQRIRACT